MYRILFMFALLTALLHLAAPAAAQPAPSASPSAAAAPVAPPAATAHPDMELRDRVTRLEGGLKAGQDDIKRQQDDHTKLKDRVDGLWTALVAVVSVLFAGLAAFFAFWFPKLRKHIVEEGRHDLTKAVVAEVMKDEPARMTKAFAAQRDEIARILLSKRRPILLEGDAAETERVRQVLEKVGYTNLKKKVFEADMILLAGSVETCEKRAGELLERAFERGLKPVVLYAPGPKRIRDELLDKLNEKTVAVTANFPSTAVTHLGTLAALTQRLPESDETEKGE